jgi:DNA topoisomerase-1
MSTKYELIITEKPNAAKKIAEALADGKAIKKNQGQVPYYDITHNKKDIIVACAVGHLYTVAEKKKSFEYPSFDLQWKATSDVDKGAAYSKKYLTVIKKLAKDANSFTVACDYDVEGEVIGLNCLRFACKQKDAKRMKFSTLTKDDLIEAFENASPTLDWGLAKAGESRHFLDWMYGINISRALMLAVKAAGSYKTLSSGRVQGPALKMLYEKEKEIEAFKPKPYWELLLKINKDKEIIEANHTKGKFFDKTKATKSFENSKEPAKIQKVTKRKVKTKPPTPFNLGDLQAESYKLFKINPKETLAIAQNLYTSGSISYPRTSSQKLPSKIGYKKILQGLQKNKLYADTAKLLLGKKTLKPNEGKKTDPAHPSIYPTGLFPESGIEREKKVYDLIVKRFFAVFGKAAVREQMSIRIDLNGEIYSTSGSRTIEPNWFELYRPYVKLKEVELPAFKEGEEVKKESLEMLEKETKPPKRYTPASVIAELEKRELGTKATRAEIVDSLYKRNYIADQSIRVTEIGKGIVETLEKYCPSIIDEELTRKIEKEMEEIKEKKLSEKDVIEEGKEHLTKVLTDFKKHEKKIGEELITANRKTQDKESYVGKCSKCKKGTLRLRYSRKTRSRFIACDAYPDCENTFSIPQAGKIKSAEENCEACGNPMITIQQAKKAPQKVCINKDCSSKEEERKEAQEEAAKRKCPKCGKELTVRNSVYGSFLGCSGYPECKYTEQVEKKEEE